METSSIDRDLVVKLTRDLICFRSVNPPGDEQPAAEHLCAWLRQHGLEAEMQVLEPNRANVLGRLPGSGDGHLVFTGHLDVVPPGGQAWEHDPFAADVVDGRIYGRGSADMKGGVAAMAAALAALEADGFRPTADLLLAATCGEEAGMLGAGAMVENRSLTGARYLVVGEPSDLDVFIGEKGVLWFDVIAYGRTAHGSMPHLGINAVSFLARLIPLLETNPFPYEESALLGGPTVSINVMSGGNKTNVVPDLARLTVDMRTVPSQRHEDILRRVRTIAEREAAQFHPDLRVQIEVDNDKQPIETDPGERLVEAAVAAATAVRGTAPRTGGVTYGTDAAALSPGYNIPMIICGPGAPGMAHQPDEWVAIDQLVQAAEIYVQIARRLLS